MMTAKLFFYIAVFFLIFTLETMSLTDQVLQNKAYFNKRKKWKPRELNRTFFLTCETLKYYYVNGEYYLEYVN